MRQQIAHLVTALRILLLAASISGASPFCVATDTTKDCWYETISSCKQAAIEKPGRCIAQSGAPIEVYEKEQGDKKNRVAGTVFLIVGSVAFFGFLLIMAANTIGK